MPENPEEIKLYIRERRDLFWYTKEDQKEKISLDFLVETILNYGSLEDAKKLFESLENDIDQINKSLEKRQ